MSFLTDMMLQVLQFFYQVGGHNYGLAIIWLTIAVNLALYPLTLSSIQQMSAMQRVQPRMQELQKKHKDDPQKLQREIMDLYKSEKVNPLGGCLPLLLKIPFFIALFVSFQGPEFKALLAVPGAGASFLWVTNLSNPEFLLILGLKVPVFAILTGLTTYFMQKTMPAATSGQSQMLTYIMPVFIALISVGFPAGVQLYWIVSNLIGGLQQAYIIKAQNIQGRA